MFGIPAPVHRLNPPVSDLWFQKQRAFFNCLDADNNGYLSLRDRDLIIRDFDNHPRVHGSRAVGRFHKLMEEIWCFLDVASKIKYEEFIEKRIAYLKKEREDPQASKPLRFGYYKLFFDLTDLNQDHHWDQEEGVMHFHVFCRDHVNAEEAMRLYHLLDTEKNGKVSFEEFAHACWVFDFDETPGPYDRLFGPLPPVSASRPTGY